MTPQDVERVQSTWAKVVPIRDTAATLFYGKLFELGLGRQHHRDLAIADFLHGEAHISVDRGGAIELPHLVRPGATY